MLTYDNLIENMLKVFPELDVKIKEKKEYYGYCDDESLERDVVFSEIFAQYAIELAKENLAYDPKLKMIFDFIEQMASAECFEVRCIAEVSFVETIIDDDLILLFRKYIKKNTRKMIDGVKKRFGVTW